MIIQLKCPKCGKNEVAKLGKKYICSACEARMTEEEFNASSTATVSKPKVNVSVTPDFNDDEYSAYVGTVHGKAQPQPTPTTTVKPTTTTTSTVKPTTTTTPQPTPKPTPVRKTSGTATIQGITYTFKSSGLVITGVNKSYITSTYTVKDEVTYDGLKYDVVEIAAKVFEGCKISSLTIQNKIKVIGEKAFYSCGINTLTLPQQLTRMDMMAFAINNITYVKIPAKVTTMGSSVFFLNPKNLVIQLSTRSVPSTWNSGWLDRDLGIFDITLKHKNIRFL